MATEKSNQVMDNIGVSVGDITKNIEQVVSSIEHISNYNLLPVFMVTVKQLCVYKNRQPSDMLKSWRCC
ncbi:MAG: hypothetical protein ACYDEX_15080 [Mobilitalea sp.]